MLSCFIPLVGMEEDDGTGWKRDIFKMNDILSQNAQNVTLRLNSRLIKALRELGLDSSIAEELKKAQENEELQKLVEHFNSQDLAAFSPCEIRDVRTMFPQTTHQVALELQNVIEEVGNKKLRDSPVCARFNSFEVSPDVARALIAHRLPVFCQFTASSRNTLALTSDELMAQDGATFIPLVFEVHIDASSELNGSVIPTTTVERGAKIANDDLSIPKACLLSLSSLQNIFRGFSQLAEVMRKKNKALINYRSLLGSDLIRSLEVDCAKWSFHKDYSIGGYSNLASVFVFYQFLIGQEGDFIGQGLSEETFSANLIATGVREDLAQSYASLWHDELLVYSWIRALLKPYASLFARINGGDTSFEGDDSPFLHPNDFAMLLERCARDFRNVGRKRARRLKARFNCEMQERESDDSGPILDLTNLSLDNFESETKARGKGKEKTNTQTESQDWKEHVKENRKARQKEKDRARHDICDEHRNNAIEEIGTAQIGPLMSLWPSERERLAARLENEFGNHHVYNAFIDPFDGRYSVTQEEINAFFVRVADLVAAFLLEEGSYTLEAIEEFVKTFIAHGQGTDHRFHGSSHTRALPASYVAHRRGALIIFGVMSSDIFKRLGKDGRQYEDKYLMRLYSKLSSPLS